MTEPRTLDNLLAENGRLRAENERLRNGGETLPWDRLVVWRVGAEHFSLAYNFARRCQMARDCFRAMLAEVGK